MGACFDYVVYKTKTVEEALQRFRGYTDDCRYEYGNGGYSGTFAEHYEASYRSDKVFGSIDEAEDWIIDEHDKWDNPICVKVVHPVDGECFVIGGWCSD